jgi:hypothetical protein
MKTFLLLLVLGVTGCGASASEGGVDFIGGVASECRLAAQTASVDPAQCLSAGKVPVYSNRFSTTCGASSVISGADALAGRAPSSTSATPSAPIDAPPSAMTVSCGEPNCAAGQVGIAAQTASASLSNAGPAQCAPPPPSCPAGQSPQFVYSSSTWTCTDCSVVITYGGAYGNYTRCASAPTISCSSGQVPTWVVNDEQWECQNTCDNGQYDQHSVAGSTVCVPC